MRKPVIKNICVVNLYGIGNTVLMIPMLKEIRDLYPSAHLSMVVTQTVVMDLLLREKVIDEFFLLDREGVGRKGKGRSDDRRYSLISIANRLISKFTVAAKVRALRTDMLFTLQPLNAKLTLFITLVNSKKTIGYSSHSRLDRILDVSIEYSECEHEFDLRCRLLEAVGGLGILEEPSLVCAIEDKLDLRNLAGTEKTRFVGLHPGCSLKLMDKRWSSSNFSDLIGKLSSQYDFYPVLFGGPDDVLVGKEIEAAAKTPLLNNIDSLSIEDTVKGIASCDYFISNDSGLMHIAAALNIPLIAIFGPSSVIKNSPRSTTSVIVQGGQNAVDPFSLLTVEKVFSAFEGLIDRVES